VVSRLASRDVDSYRSGMALRITWCRHLPLWAGTPCDPVSRGFRPDKRLINDTIRGRGLLAIDPMATRPGIDVGRVAVAVAIVVAGAGARSRLAWPAAARPLDSACYSTYCQN
jgi:hypothetical protein